MNNDKGSTVALPGASEKARLAHIEKTYGKKEFQIASAAHTLHQFVALGAIKLHEDAENDAQRRDAKIAAQKATDALVDLVCQAGPHMGADQHKAMACFKALEEVSEEIKARVLGKDDPLDTASNSQIAEAAATVDAFMKAAQKHLQSDKKLN